MFDERGAMNEGWRRVTNWSVNEDERSESGGERSSTTVIGRIGRKWYKKGVENAERSTRASIASDMAKLVSKLKVDTEKYDLYSSAADVSDEGKIGSWMQVGEVRVHTHTHTPVLRN